MRPTHNTYVQSHFSSPELSVADRRLRKILGYNGNSPRLISHSRANRPNGRIVLVLLALAGLAAIAAVYFPKPQPSQQAGLEGVVMLEVPFVRQKPYFCSEASASMILQHYGFSLSQDEIHELGFDRFEVMLPLLQRYVNCHYASLSVDELRREIDEGDPVMVRLTIPTYHTVVVVGYGPDSIYIHDPASGPSVRVSLEAFLQRWGPERRAIVFESGRSSVGCRQ